MFYELGNELAFVGEVERLFSTGLSDLSVHVKSIILVISVQEKQLMMPSTTFFAEEPAAAEVPVTFKGIAQFLCENRGIELAPIPNRFIEGKQLYKCGKRKVYFDQNLIFVGQRGGSFAPMSWLELVENV